MNNYYKILGVEDNASPDEIKKTYRKLSLLHHPDKNPGNPEAEAKFKTINEAYDTLGDIEKKQEYDRMRNNPFMGGHGGGGMSGFSGMNQGMNPMDDIFKMFFGGQMPVGQMPGGQMRGGVHNMGNMGNIHIVGNMLNKPPPIIKNLVISLEQSYKGDQQPVQIERWIFEDDIRKIENETLYIPIMKGIDDKEIIILRDKGNVMNNTLKGDVKIVITIQNLTNFKRDGLNLHIEKEISLKESLCGFNFIIDHISGKQLRYNSEAGVPTKSGLIKAIPGFGMEREGNKGSLCIKFNIKYPDKLTAEQIEKIKEIF